MASWIQYWKNGQVDRELAGIESGGRSPLLIGTRGNFLRAEGVEVGDTLYVVTVQDGRLWLIGRMVVDQYVPAGDSKWHDRVAATKHQATRLSVERALSDTDTKRLRHRATIN